MKLFLTVAAAVVLAGAASAQNYNAFKDVTFSDVTVTHSGNSFTVTLGADPMVMRGGKKESFIKDITGFWVLGANGGVNGVQQNATGFMEKSNSGGGRSAYGWMTQNKNGLTANESFTFNFGSLDLSKVTDFGFMLHANGIPAHVKIGANMQAVPEPFSMLGLAAGCGMLIRKRKKQ